MQLSRRQMIEVGGAAGVLSLVANSPLFAAAIDPAPAPIRRALAPVPAAPRVMVDPVINANLLARARASFDRHRPSLRYTDFVGITDFSRASGEHRFFLLDTATGRVSRHLVSHGRGSDPSHTGFLQHFSNAVGSNATSAGGYVTSDYYHGKYGRSMRVNGLDRSNSNANERAIVVHSAWYAEPEVVAQTGRLGRSEGCFAFSTRSHQEVMARLGPGRFLYADRV